MKFVGWILGGLLALAVLRMAVAVLLLAVLLVVLIGLITSPARTLSTLFGFVLLNAFAAYPMEGLLLLSIILIGGRLSQS